MEKLKEKSKYLFLLVISILIILAIGLMLYKKDSKTKMKPSDKVSINRINEDNICLKSYFNDFFNEQEIKSIENDFKNLINAVRNKKENEKFDIPDNSMYLNIIMKIGKENNGNRAKYGQIISDMSEVRTNMSEYNLELIAGNNNQDRVNEINEDINLIYIKYFN